MYKSPVNSFRISRNKVDLTEVKSTYYILLNFYKNFCSNLNQKQPFDNLVSNVCNN